MKKYITLQLVVSLIAIVVAFVFGSLTGTLFNDDDEVYCEQDVCEINHERIYSFGFCTHSTLRYRCNMTRDGQCSASPCGR